jgi:hypothetical protein
MADCFAGLPAEERDKLRRGAQPRWTAPMLATLTHEPFSDAGWIYERKLDGVRCLVFRAGRKLRLLSRSQEPHNDTYPELAEAFAAQAADDFIVDGEIVAFGHDTTRLAQRHRKVLLRRALDFEDPIRFTPHRNEHGEAYIEEACAKGWEGLIAKRADAPVQGLPAPPGPPARRAGRGSAGRGGGSHRRGAPGPPSSGRAGSDGSTASSTWSAPTSWSCWAPRRPARSSASGGRSTTGSDRDPGAGSPRGPDRMSRRRGAVRIGTSGYHYAHWKGVFYPRELSKDEWFGHYADQFDTVEINNTFYHLPSTRTFTAWREQAPPGFLYAVKLSRYATHLKHLKDPRRPLRTFLGRAERLGSATRASGTRWRSTTATSRPSCRREAATSQPMKPKPITTARRAPRTAARIPSQSSTVRSWNTPSSPAPGTDSERFRPPVATRSRL